MALPNGDNAMTNREIVPLGQRFWRLSYLADTFYKAGTPRLCAFRCDCGNEVVKALHEVKRGNCKSCGCLPRERMAARNYKHGLTGDKVYPVWAMMRARCNNPLATDYARYGGRGITVCDRWNDFAAFKADMGPRPTPRHTIDRRDTNGNYEPDNCYWATPKQQANNRHNTPRAVINGVSMTATEIVEATGLSRNVVRKRIKDGLPIQVDTYLNNGEKNVA